jgi:hypothetical protein
MPQMRTLALYFIVLAQLSILSPAYARWCAMSPPVVAGSKVQLHFDCHDAKQPNAVEYPNTTLYIGATLVKSDPKNKSRVIIYSGRTDEPGSFDLRPVSIPFDPNRDWSTTTAEFVADKLSDYSHLLVAVWDSQEPCDSQYIDNPLNGCKLYGFVLGGVDDEEYPAPIDVWPRPICDVSYLTKIGFFVEGKDPSRLPRKLQGAFELSDCWSLVKRGGLGYSLRRWRAAPIPAAAQ